jgi:putative transposase
MDAGKRRLAGDTARGATTGDVQHLALAASGCDSATVLHKPRLLSDNGPSYIAGELAEYIQANKMSHVRGPVPSADPRKD